MRVMLKAQFDVQAANEATKDGSLPAAFQQVMERLQPEAAYFLPQEGKRTCLMFFDLKDPSQIPVVAEPFFQIAKAAIDITPAMTVEDLQKGLREAKQAS